MDESSEDGITVITLTRYRPLTVQRAMHSVRDQRYKGPVRHLVLVDDSRQTMTTLERLVHEFPGCELHYVPREDHEVSGPGRSSRLRNLGVRLASEHWVAFLDDDNEWDRDHLDSLLACAREHQARAVYSEVGLLHGDGEPYLEPRWPWANNVTEAERMYTELVARGICTPGSNVISDQPGCYDVPPDTSSWLLARELLVEVPFEDSFSDSDARELVSEDDKLYYELVRRGEQMACTRRPTLKYYLGGYSNSFETVDSAEKISWS